MLFILVSILGIVLWSILLLSRYFQRKNKSQDFTPPSMGSSAGVHSIQGTRNHMEDTYQAALNIDNNPKHAFYAVYDGHGGHLCSDFAADRLHRELLLQPNLMDNPVEALETAFHELDHSWLIRASKNFYDDGSTAITSLILNKTLYVANVGDSRAVLCSGGKAIEMSRDHKPNRSDEKKRIEDLGGRIVHIGTWRVEGVLAVTRAIGDRRLKKYVCSAPEISERKLTEDDEYLILASDGVWDVMSSQDAVDVIKSCNGKMEAAAKKLTKTAYRRGSLDNITSLVINLAHYR